ncbi:MAG: RluA family pseudouridine synthase [Gammaproteobacteria bacterium]
MVVRSEVQILTVTARHAGQRLDNFLLRELPDLPRARIYRLIRRGEVRVNKKRCKPAQRLELSDQVRIPPVLEKVRGQPGIPSAGLNRLLQQSLLYEDEDLLVINKPAGLSVHGGSGIRLGVIEAMRQLRPQWQALELAHRLDRDTSGCLVLAKNINCLREIQAGLKDKRVEKHYLALVHGKWPDSLAEVCQPLLKNQLSSGERVVRVDPHGKQALTRFRVLQRHGDQATLLEAAPVTGRTHQIRVHCQYAGHPIVGDSKYAEAFRNSPLGRYKLLCLHAHRIAFRSRPEGPLIEVEATPDNKLSSMLKSLN